MKSGLKKMVLLFLLTVTCFNNIKAATFDWTGDGTCSLLNILGICIGTYINTTSWKNADNWTLSSGSTSTGYPVAGDIARFGVSNNTYTNSPVIGSGENISCAGITYGPKQAVNLVTINGTLTLSTDIIVNYNNNGSGTVSNYIKGSGTVSCANIKVGTGTTISTTAFNFFYSEVKTLNVSGDVNTTMTVNKPNGTGFRLENGNMYLTGQIKFTTISGNTSANAAYFTVNGTNPSGQTNPSLYLLNQFAVPTLPAQVGGINIATVNFNGNRPGGKVSVYYTGANPTVYTTSLVGFGTGGGTIVPSTPQYDNLYIQATGTTTIGTGTGILQLDSALNTSSPVSFGTYNTTSTIGTNWINSSTITGGSGTTSVVGALTNAGIMNMASGNITIGANYTNTGTFTQAPAASDPTVVTPAATNTAYFTAASPVINNATSSDITNFNNLVITGGASGTPSFTGSGGFSISSLGVLQIKTSGTVLQTNGLLTLKSDASSTATVAAIPTSATIAGNVNVQRYITGGSGYRGYRLVSSPVNVTSNTSGGGNLGLGYLSTSQIFDGTTYSGALTGGPGTGFFVTNGNPSLYLYDESRTTDNTSFVAGKNVGIYSITGSTVTTLSGKPAVQTSGVSIPVGNSFLLYFIGDNSSTTTSSSRTPENATVTAAGYLNQGNVAVKFWKLGTTAIPYTVGGNGSILPGYNQVGNPYASTINLDVVYTDNYIAGTNAISPIFWELNVPGQTYYSYNAQTTATSNARASKYIVSGQGFIMDATATGQTITFKEGQKVVYPAITNATTPALLMSTKGDIALLNKSFKSTANEPLLTGLHLQLTKDSVVNTQCGIYFNKNWDDHYYNTEDALDLDGMAPKVFMSSYSVDGVRTSINQLGDYAAKGKKVKLFVKATSSGFYTIDLVDIKNIDTIKYKVYLLDHLKSDSLDIGKYKSYAFNILLTDTATFGAGRFELSVQQVPGHKYQLATFNAQKATDGVLVTWRAYNEGGNYFFTLEKQQADGTDYSPVYETQSNGATIYKYTDKTPNTGNNVYRLKQVDLYGNITYSGPVNIYFDKSGNAGMFSLYPNPTVETLNVKVTYGNSTTAASSYKLNVYDATGTLVMQKTSDNNSWSENVSQFKPGVYIVELNDNSGNSLGKAKFLKK